MDFDSLLTLRCSCNEIFSRRVEKIRDYSAEVFENIHAETHVILDIYPNFVLALANLNDTQCKYDAKGKDF